MLRHPHYLELPWDLHGHHEATGRHHLWWLIALLVMLAILLTGVGVTHGIF
jgi:hypothetical protein